ncbi:hypothetical protein Bbelb_172370 [Branchiostoma belcheri]|nr:hypothetical protein Bbelb_172370 [Branchiostoma belcheri]
MYSNTSAVLLVPDAVRYLSSHQENGRALQQHCEPLLLLRVARLSVDCSYSEPPSRGGSDKWEPQQKHVSGRRACVESGTALIDLTLNEAVFSCRAAESDDSIRFR